MFDLNPSETLQNATYSNSSVHFACSLLFNGFPCSSKLRLIFNHISELKGLAYMGKKDFFLYKKKPLAFLSVLSLLYYIPRLPVGDP